MTRRVAVGMWVKGGAKNNLYAVDRDKKYRLSLSSALR